MTDFAYLLREGDAEPRVVRDRHVEGLFPRHTWRRLMELAGFEVRSATRPDDDGKVDEVFIGLRI